MRAFLMLMLTASVAAAQEAPRKALDANRLAYLDSFDPYYPSHFFPKLITPQWVGDKDVECVVILGIDDMRDPKRYEAYLRPILRRLQEIDGRAPLSIMTCSVDPKDPQLQTWLKEGVSLECHTVDHPCPFFKNGFAKAKDTYDRCVDLLNQVPNNKPVAFRMPCCDSMNTPSPRHWAEIFNKTTEKGNYLTIDTSVFNVFTSADPELPRELVLNDKGEERFNRYLPADRSFVNTIENYPYPYVIGRLCWEFPCMTPSDWQAQHLQKPNNPDTVRDMKAALDCAVVKKVKFLNFREAQERLNRRWFDLRRSNFGDNGVRILDLNADGYLDAVVARLGDHDQPFSTFIWSPATNAWEKSSFPIYVARPFADESGKKVGSVETGRFGFDSSGATIFLARFPLVNGAVADGGWVFGGQKWRLDADRMQGLRIDKLLIGTTGWKGDIYFDNGFRLVDINGDGSSEVILSNPKHQALFQWSAAEKIWAPLPCTFPKSASVVDEEGKDNGLRFLDLNDDGKLDVVFSNEKEYGIYLFTDMEKGWSKKVLAGQRGAKPPVAQPPVADAPGSPLPMISRNGANNGFWVHSGHLWWSNEDTVLLKDHVDRRNIKQLLDRAN